MTTHDSYRKMRAATWKVVLTTNISKEIPHVNVKIQGSKLRMTEDTEATINVLDRHTFDQMTNVNLQPANVKAYAYKTTTPLKFLGKVKAAEPTQIRGCNILCSI